MQRIAIGCLCLILSSSIFADELQVPIGQQGDQANERPSSGMARDVVEETFGAPENIQGPVGEPPITIWRYSKFSVYFEYDYVIHTVLHKS
ncbi:MAG: hypothetical protein DRQ47_10790 [Gammaproteobacteria bacterium]|nr:MAG: hypothetical protein DRQ47_10790 [Gammaproteobacteria bacterium]